MNDKRKQVVQAVVAIVIVVGALAAIVFGNMHFKEQITSHTGEVETSAK